MCAEKGYEQNFQAKSDSRSGSDLSKKNYPMKPAGETKSDGNFQG